MENRINEYLDTLFDCGPQNRKAYELRDEMKQNLIEKYHDLVAEGRSPEDAYNEAINSLGDVSELFDDLEREDDPEWQPQPQQVSKNRSRSAVLTAIAVALYILSPLPIIIGDEIGGSEVVGLGFFFCMIAAATGLLIYNHMTKPYVRRSNTTVVEDFREYRQEVADKGSRVGGAIKGAMWCLTFAVYFVVSFFTMKWYITWVIFLIAGALSSLISLIFCGNDTRRIVGAVNGAFWCLVVAAYFLISFRTMAWHITWVIFLIASAISSLMGIIGAQGSRKRIVGAITGAMWCGIVAAYFIISFWTMAWHITWVIFLLGAAASVILGAIGKERA